MTITTLSAHKGNTWKIELDDSGELFFLHVSVVQRCGLRKGMTLTPQQWEQVQTAELSRKAYQYACFLLDNRGYSYQEMFRKLEPKYPQAVCFATVDRLAKYGQINDRAYAEQLAHHYVAVKRFGMRRAFQEMRRRGLLEEHITEALEPYEDEVTGEILTEKSGNLNLGIPGIMYVGGICGVIGAFFYEQAVPADQMSGFLAIMIPMLCSLLGSLLMGLLYCFLTVTLRANQNVTGLTMTTFGVGIGNFFGGSLIKLTGSEVPSIALSATSGYFAKSLPFAKSLGWFGQIFLSYGFLAYLAIILALLTSYFLKHTRPGLHLRSVGESASTADAAGINVTRYKYLATCIGSMIAGLGGLYYVMDYASGVWSNNAFGDRGWLAIALVIFTIWRPNVSVLASILFGGLYILYLYIPTGTQMAVKELYKMLPYVVTVVVLVISSLRNNKEKQPPASLGLSYFREER